MDRVKATARTAVLSMAEFAVFLLPALALLATTWQCITRYQNTIVRLITS